MGVPSVGKSTAIKYIVITEYMRGTKLIFIDPHREYWEYKFTFLQSNGQEMGYMEVTQPQNEDFTRVDIL